LPGGRHVIERVAMPAAPLPEPKGARQRVVRELSEVVHAGFLAAARPDAPLVRGRRRSSLLPETVRPGAHLRPDGEVDRTIQHSAPTEGVDSAGHGWEEGAHDDIA